MIDTNTTPTQPLNPPTSNPRAARGAATAAVVALVILIALSLAPRRDGTPFASAAPGEIVATPALKPLVGRLQSDIVIVPKDAPVEAAAPTTQPAAPVVEQIAQAAPVAEQVAAPAAPVAEAPAPAAVATVASPAIVYSSDPQIPAGVQALVQTPDSSYITVDGGPARYYLNPDMTVAEVRLPGIDTAPDTGRDLAVVTQEQIAADQAQAAKVAEVARTFAPPKNATAGGGRSGWRGKVSP